MRNTIMAMCDTADCICSELVKAEVLYLEITDQCNMACPMCMTRDHRQQPEKPTLTRKQILEKLLKPACKMGLGLLTISGGEPTLSEHLVGILSDSVQFGFNAFLASNLLSSDVKLYKDILSVLDAPSHTFMVSFDSVEPSEMNLIRGRDVYADVLRNCRNLVELRSEMGTSTTLLAAVVLQPVNAGSVPKTLKFILDDIGFDKVVVQPRSDYSNVSLSNYRHQPFPKHSPGTLDSLIKAARQVFAMATADDRIFPTGDSFEDWQRYFTNPLATKGPCKSPRLIYVDSYGNFRGCLYGTILTNIYETNLESYLWSDIYKEFLKLTKVCKICIHGCS